MAPKVYLLKASPVARTFLILAKAIDFKYEPYELDMLNGEHLTEKYTKLNPLQTIPTLDDNGQVIYNNHVVTAYLVDKYGKNDSFYPKDHYKRALVNQGLFFNSEMLIPVLKDIDIAYYTKEITCMTPRMIEMITTVYDLLERILNRQEWVSLDQVTIADFNCYTTVTSLAYHIPIKAEKYPKIDNWIKRCAELPYCEEDSEHLETFYSCMKLLDAQPYIE